MKKRMAALGLVVLSSFALACCSDPKPTTTPVGSTPAVSTTPVVSTPGATTTPVVSTPGATTTPVVSTPLATTTPVVSTPTVTPTGDIVTSGSFETPEIPGTVVTPTTPSQVNDVKFEKKAFNNSLKKDGPMTYECFPSTGTPKLLVIPVNLDDSKKNNETLAEIDLAFNGTEETTGWESVKSFYQESSYGKLNMECDVMDEWFTPSKAASYYESYYDYDTYSDGTSLILSEALAYYETKLDLSDYDYDNDGFIDSVWLIYNKDVDYVSSDSIYWAYVTWSADEVKYDGKYCCYYGWAGTDFMHEETQSYPTDGFVVDAHTYIHETGHLMGLDDYYDYDESVGADGGLYGADMMDWNIGDHGVLSKLLLGWISPTIVTGTGIGEIDLTPFVTSGDCLLIADHEITSIYDEYFLVEYYRNDGLNYNDYPILDGDYEEADGVRITHVDAHKYYNANGEEDWNDDNVYPTGFKYDNSGTKYNMVEQLRADYNTMGDDYLDYKSLFTSTSAVFGVDVYQSYKTHEGKALNFNLAVKQIKDKVCTVQITLK